MILIKAFFVNFDTITTIKTRKHEHFPYLPGYRKLENAY